MATPPAAELVDDVVAEILLRLPPGSSKCLVRASAVCKSWRRVLRDPAFLRCYRELHRPPPELGFLRYRHGFTGRDYRGIRQPDLAVVEGDRLYLWSEKQNELLGMGLPLRRVIDLKKLLPAHASSLSPLTFGLEEGVGTIFLGTDAGAFMIDLRSEQVRRVSVMEVFHATVPHISVETKDYSSKSSSVGTALKNTCICFGEFCFDLNRAEEVCCTGASAMPQRKLIFEGANLRKKRKEEEPKKPKILIGSMPLEIAD